ncbi:MAG: hypothetical protein ROZ37_17765 [Aromatoleum sp.]|uniref:hypothetical protein n=1 Tax=Aromatoleum sp. TaxID=2307007 RepID=UPI002894EE27|nr:hypothetical protein [Aromatoleum sp.]MDT3672172.1 hypothetical protein [Aromatoleum sp.]
MFPLLPFAAGLLRGAVATRLLKVDKARLGFDKAQNRVREATVSSLAAIEHTSAELRAKLARGSEDAEGSETDSPRTTETVEQPQGDSAAEAATVFMGQGEEESVAAEQKPKTTRTRARTKRPPSTASGAQTEKPEEDAQ